MLQLRIFRLFAHAELSHSPVRRKRELTEAAGAKRTKKCTSFACVNRNKEAEKNRPCPYSITASTAAWSCPDADLLTLALCQSTSPLQRPPWHLNNLSQTCSLWEKHFPELQRRHVRWDAGLQQDNTPGTSWVNKPFSSIKCADPMDQVLPSHGAEKMVCVYRKLSEVELQVCVTEFEFALPDGFLPVWLCCCLAPGLCYSPAVDLQSVGSSFWQAGTLIKQGWENGDWRSLVCTICTRLAGTCSVQTVSVHWDGGTKQSSPCCPVLMWSLQLSNAVSEHNSSSFKWHSGSVLQNYYKHRITVWALHPA